MQVVTALAQQLEDFLNLSSAELKVTAANMANLDTPGYRTKGFDFRQAMEGALLRDAAAPPAPALGGSAPAAPDILTPSSSDPELSEVDGLIARPDGNTVSLDREGLKMAGAQLKFRIGVELLKREYASVSEAIHADAK